MKATELEIGATYTYWPPQNADDNLHFPAVVIEVGKRVKVRVMKAGSSEGVTCHVSPRRLTEQRELRMESRGGGRCRRFARVRRHD